MKRKNIASVAMSLAMVTAMPLTSLATVLTATNITTATVVAAEIETESSGYKDGDIMTFSKEDWKLEQKSGIRQSADTLYVYSTKLDSEGKKSLVATLSADDDTDGVAITYNSNYGYMVVVDYGDIQTTMRPSYYYYLDNDGNWKHFWVSGKNISIPPLALYFTEDNLGSLYSIIGDNPIHIYKKNSDGSQTYIQDVYCKGSANYGKDNRTDVIFASGLEFEDYVWSVDIDYTLDLEMTENQTKGVIYGAWLADKPYVIDKDIEIKTIPKERPLYAIVGTPISAISIFDLQFPKTDESGNVIYDEYGQPELEDLLNIEHGDIWIIENTETIKSVSAGDLRYGFTSIENYDSDKAYFVKVGTDPSNTEFMYFRYNPRGGWWDFRVNTKDTPLYVAPITIAEYPDELADGIMYDKGAVDGEYDAEYDKWSAEDFVSGDKNVKILTNNDKFTYTSFFDYGEQGGIYYQYVGIDPIPVYAYGDRAEGSFVNRKSIESNAKAGDVILVEGTDADGTQVCFEVTQQFDNDNILCGDGSYLITNKTKELVAEINNGDIDSPFYDNINERDVLNLSAPIIESSYSIKTMTGENVLEGELNVTDKFTLDNLVEDAGIPDKQVEWFQSDPYYTFESSVGITNSTNPDDYLVDEGYFIFDNSEDAKKGNIIRVYTTGVDGDVNQDEAFGIADLVAYQKYLLGAINEDDWQIENFIASNVCVDKTADVFDMVVLRQMLLKELG